MNATLEPLAPDETAPTADMPRFFVPGELPKVEQCVVSDFDRVTGEVRGEIIRILTDPDCKGPNRNRQVATLVVEFLCKVGKLYYHADRQDFDSAMFFNSHAKRLARVRSDAFVAWLSEWIGINRADFIYTTATTTGHSLRRACLQSARKHAAAPVHLHTTIIYK